MLDTIVYIPTILAYAFISLLLIILSFIVIYVSHKVYLIIYDNLPVPSTNRVELYKEINTGQQYIYTDTIGGGQFMHRKSKAALNILISLEPCYLAVVKLEVTSIAATNSNGRAKIVLQYFDRLSNIPWYSRDTHNKNTEASNIVVTCIDNIVENATTTGNV